MINEDGLYSDIGLIDSVIVTLDQVEVKGLDNMSKIIDCVNRLSALKEGLTKEKEAKADGNNNDGQRILV